MFLWFLFVGEVDHLPTLQSPHVMSNLPTWGHGHRGQNLKEHGDHPLFLDVIMQQDASVPELRFTLDSLEPKNPVVISMVSSNFPVALAKNPLLE